MTDPPRRQDNTCACGCGRPLPGLPTRRQRGIPDHVYLTEPFARTECAKAYYGLRFPSIHELGRRRKVA